MSRVLFGRLAGGLIAAATVCTAIVSAPGVALASTAQWNTVYEMQDDNVFDLRTSSTYWTVAAVRSKPGQDFDLAVTSASSGQVATSDAYGGDTDFVAIDTNRLAPGNYQANVYRFGGDGSDGYDFQFASRNVTFTPTLYGQTTGSPGNSQDQVDYDPAVSRGTDVVRIYDVSLQAGQYYVLKSAYDFRDDGNVFLLSSDPANKATWMRGRPAALRVTTKNMGVHGGGCTRFKAARTAWYGLVVLFDDHNGGYHDYEVFDVEKAKSTDGTFCEQAGSF
jgi:hypothetical protein